MTGYVLAIDQGTTSTRALVFDGSLQVVAGAQREFTQHFPRSGWVEHDPEDLWTTSLDTARLALEGAGVTAAKLAAIGITNQRETVVLWDRETGKPVGNAIVWQDRRTADVCARLRAEGAEPLVSGRTGLILDPYFSATKIAWMLDNVPGARARAEAGKLAVGTVDCWLIWRLTRGKVHATDATNAARTLVYDIHKGTWDDELLKLFGIPASLLPEVRDCADDFGVTEPSLFGAPVAIRGVAGDQQAATVGQACFQPGMLKSTYGTGCFAVLNTGDTPVVSRNRLLTTIAYRLDGKPTYALEGSIFIAGAAVQWLRDGLRLISFAAETQDLAERADPEQDVYLVPAFVGLGAPHWDPDARGALFGITRATGPAEFARAALESVGFQTRDLLEAMWRDCPEIKGAETVLRVDGGMTASNWTMQFLADVTGSRVERPKILETTALGAAYLAGKEAGVCPGLAEFAATWKAEHTFQPQMPEERRRRRYEGWGDAVERTLSQR